MRKLRKTLLTLLALGATASVTVLGAFSAFSATTANSGNQIATGTVALQDNDAGSVLYDVTNAKPGDSVEKCIQVTYTGSLASDVRLYTPDTLGALAQYVDLQITPGTQASATFPDCTGFTASGAPLFTGTLDGVRVHARRLGAPACRRCRRRRRLERQRRRRLPHHRHHPGQPERQRPEHRPAQLRVGSPQQLSSPSHARARASALVSASLHAWSHRGGRNRPRRARRFVVPSW